VTSIADDFGVAPASLRRWNHLKSDALRRGRMLVVYRPLTAAELASAPRKPHKRKSLAGAQVAKQNSKSAPSAPQQPGSATLVSPAPR
jgi:LysM repeat protein